MDKLKIILGADHAGYALKEKIKKYLEKKKIQYEDAGAYKLNPKDDYVDYAVKAAKKVSKSKNTTGILVCGTGTGMEIAANKIKGIRAAMGYDTYSAKMAKEHNDANILGLRSRNISFDKTKKIIDAWLNTKFSSKQRHRRRVNKIKRLEK